MKSFRRALGVCLDFVRGRPGVCECLGGCRRGARRLACRSAVRCPVCPLPARSGGGADQGAGCPSRFPQAGRGAPSYRAPSPPPQTPSRSPPPQGQNQGCDCASWTVERRVRSGGDTLQGHRARACQPQDADILHLSARAGPTGRCRCAAGRYSSCGPIAAASNRRRRGSGTRLPGGAGWSIRRPVRSGANNASVCRRAGAAGGTGVQRAGTERLGAHVRRRFRSRNGAASPQTPTFSRLAVQSVRRGRIKRGRHGLG